MCINDLTCCQSAVHLPQQKVILFLQLQVLFLQLGLFRFQNKYLCALHNTTATTTSKGYLGLLRICFFQHQKTDSYICMCIFGEGLKSNQYIFQPVPSCGLICETSRGYKCHSNSYSFFYKKYTSHYSHRQGDNKKHDRFFTGPFRGKLVIVPGMS